MNEQPDADPIAGLIERLRERAATWRLWPAHISDKTERNPRFADLWDEAADALSAARERAEAAETKARQAMELLQFLENDAAATAKLIRAFFAEQSKGERTE